MAQDVLVSDYPGSRRQPLLHQGAALLNLLDKQGIPVTAAFWFRDPDSQTWTYYLASPRVETEGPLRVYKTLQEHVGQAGLTLQDIAVVSPRDRLVSLLRLRVSPSPVSALDRTLAVDRVHDVLLDDAYIYRLA